MGIICEGSQVVNGEGLKIPVLNWNKQAYVVGNLDGKSFPVEVRAFESRPSHHFNSFLLIKRIKVI